jgi:hypothetical protein
MRCRTPGKGNPCWHCPSGSFVDQISYGEPHTHQACLFGVRVNFYACSLCSRVALLVGDSMISNSRVPVTIRKWEPVVASCLIYYLVTVPTEDLSFQVTCAGLEAPDRGYRGVC